MAHDIAVVTEAELRKVVGLDVAAVDVVEGAFKALATGKVVMPPILSMAIPEANGEVDVKTAWLPGFSGFAIKVSPGFFDNPKLGLPSLNGLMILFSARTGLVEALFLDNGYLTDVRTAAAGAVAARHMAPSRITTAGVMGTGVQARLQIEAAHLVRPFEEVLVWGRDSAKAKACAADISARLKVKARAETDPARLVAQSQLVVTTTPAREPILKAEDILRLQQIVRQVPVSDHVVRYALSLVRQTRVGSDGVPDFVDELVGWGAGPRAVQFLILGGKARALLEGRFHVQVEDIQALAKSVLRHRVVVNFAAESDGVSSDDVIERIIAATPTTEDELTRDVRFQKIFAT